jgi:hypothetical protein
VIKVSSTSSVEERVRRIEHSINYSNVILTFSCADANTTITAGAGNVFFGGCAVDRAWSRTVLPDAQWVVRAAGFANSGDGNPFVVSLIYQTNALAVVTLGSATTSVAGFVKLAMGPFDVFGTGGVPAGEAIPVIRIIANKGAGTNAQIAAWTIWLELRANKQ